MRRPIVGDFRNGTFFRTTNCFRDIREKPFRPSPCTGWPEIIRTKFDSSLFPCGLTDWASFGLKRKPISSATRAYMNGSGATRCEVMRWWIVDPCPFWPRANYLSLTSRHFPLDDARAMGFALKESPIQGLHGHVWMAAERHALELHGDKE